VLGPFLFLSSRGGGRQLGGVGVTSVVGGEMPGGQGLGLTHDVTGHVWMLGDRRSPERFVLESGGGSQVERRCHGAPPSDSRFPRRWLRPPGLPRSAHVRRLPGPVRAGRGERS